MIARTIKKIHVPAKLPEDEGVQALEKSGVSWALWNTMAMLIELDEELILCEVELWLLISMPSMIYLVCEKVRPRKIKKRMSKRNIKNMK